jgi:hypothetical protein
MWAAVLLPPFLRNRATRRPNSSIHSFRHQLRVLERNSPRGNSRSQSFGQGAYPGSYGANLRMSRAQAAKRRRDVLLLLMTAASITLLIGVLPGLHAVLVIHVLIDVVLVGFVVLSARQRQMADDRVRQMRYMREVSRPQGAMVMRRAGSRY